MANKQIDVNNIWIDFKSEGNIADKHKLMLHYIWLIKYVIQQMTLPQNSILNEEDFVNIGILGLNDAIERFEPQRGVKFESFAIPRIKGIIQDELRRLDWLSRSARKKASEVLAAADKLRSEYGREVSPEEIRIKLNVTHEKYKSYLAAAAAAKASLSMTEATQTILNDDDEEVNILEEIPDDSQDNYLSAMENEERIKFITDFIAALKEKKRLVMTLYYYESLTFKEIGNALSVSESRVCQIHTQVVGELKDKLREFDNA